MTKNVIELLRVANQELFHSAFIAWLMDDQEAHGFGRDFRTKLLEKLPASWEYDCNSGFEVKTEFRLHSGRADILLRPSESSRESKGIVIENKTKSFGNHLQLDTYGSQGYDVVVLALLPETLDAESRGRYPLITYSQIRDILQSLPLEAAEKQRFLVAEYRDFLGREVGIFELLRAYISGDIGFAEYRDGLSRIARAGLPENDIRTYSFFYYHALREFIETAAPDLLFGTETYQSAKERRPTLDGYARRICKGRPSWRRSFTLHSKLRIGH